MNEPKLFTEEDMQFLWRLNFESEDAYDKPAVYDKNGFRAVATIVKDKIMIHIFDKADSLSVMKFGDTAEEVFKEAVAEWEEKRMQLENANAELQKMLGQLAELEDERVRAEAEEMARQQEMEMMQEEQQPPEEEPLPEEGEPENDTNDSDA